MIYNFKSFTWGVCVGVLCCSFFVSIVVVFRAITNPLLLSPSWPTQQLAKVVLFDRNKKLGAFCDSTFPWITASLLQGEEFCSIQVIESSDCSIESIVRIELLQLLLVVACICLTRFQLTAIQIAVQFSILLQIQ